MAAPAFGQGEESQWCGQDLDSDNHGDLLSDAGMLAYKGAETALSAESRGRVPGRQSNAHR